MSLAQVRRGSRSAERRRFVSTGPALVNHYTALTSTNTSTNNITGVTAAAGQVMVLCGSLAVGNTTRIITAITDPGGNTWTKQQAITGASGNNSRAEIWTAPVTTGFTAGTVAASSGAQTLDGFFDVSVWSGVTVTGATGNAVGQITTSTAAPACTVTTAGAAAVISAATWAQTTAPTTVGTGWTLFGGGSSGASDYGAAGYLVASTAGTYGPSWVTTSATVWGLATIQLPTT